MLANPDRFRDKLESHPELKRMAKFLIRAPRFIRDKRMSKKYIRWLEQTQPYKKSEAVDQLNKLEYKPLISVVVPVYRPPVQYLKDMISSVKDQVYDNWELILIDDASDDETIKLIIIESAETDDRVRYKFLKKNRHISGATNEGILRARGEFICLLDNDDLLYPNALLEVAKVINLNPEAGFIYSDEEKYDDKSGLRSPSLKPDWNPDFLRSVNYITHFVSIRKRLVDELGGERGEFNGAQDWELFLRITRSIPESSIKHIPKVLYQWRVHSGSTAGDINAAKPYVLQAQRAVLQDDIKARILKDKNAILTQDSKYSAQWEIAYYPNSRAKISIMVANDIDKAKVSSMFDYDDYEILSYSTLSDIKGVVRNAAGEFVMIIAVLPAYDMSFDDIQKLQGDAMRDRIGFVSTRYSSNDDIFIKLDGTLSPDVLGLAKTMKDRDFVRHIYTTTKYNANSIGTGSVVLIKKSTLVKILDAAQDADVNSIESLSAKAHDIGLRNIYNPYVRW